MSRTLLNFLIFEDLFDNLDTSNGLIVDLAKQLFVPYVRIVSENCGTKLGKVIDVSPSINGDVRIDFNGVLDSNRMIPEEYRISKADIEGWLSQSIYKTKVRDLHYCSSVGGVCATCYAATMNSPAPVVGLSAPIRNRYILHDDHFLTTAGNPSYSLTVTPGTYDFTNAYLDNHFLTESEFSIVDNSIILTKKPLHGQYLRVDSIINSNKPFMAYLASSFSGDLLGLESVTQQPITLPLGTIDRGIKEGSISLLLEQVESLNKVDRTMIDYLHTITNKVEKSLYLLTLASIYNDIQT